MGTTGQQKTGSGWVFWLIVFGIYLACRQWSAYDAYVDREQVRSAPPAAASEPIIYVPHMGEVGVLNDGMAGEDVIVSTSPESEKQTVDALAASDKAELDELLIVGKIFLARTGSRIKYLGGITSNQCDRVRFIGGEHDGQEGWIPMEWFKK